MAISAEKKKGPGWLPRLRKMDRDYDTKELEHATAVAAAAFAINSLEIPERPESSLQKSKSKMDGSKSPVAQLRSASKRFSGKEINRKTQSKLITIFNLYINCYLLYT